MRPLINCDMGEGFGKYRLANDEAIMPLIDQANIACGFHASDPVIMQQTVDMAIEHGKQIGAHPSLPDLQGFGRREMKIAPAELLTMIKYQVGALDGMLRGRGVTLSHIKPHGALYGMACRDHRIAEAIADAALAFNLPVLGLGGTCQETTYKAKGVTFVGEFYADLDYNEHGHLLIVTDPGSLDATQAAARARQAIASGYTTAVNGATVRVDAESICVHSDNRGAIDLLTALRKAFRLDEAMEVLS
ncbi:MULTISPECIES: 5-oxoprolinase subunit PxpA [unclassified Oceanobacter]|jgi:UPF0271 protein|uniref:5-oxoprolinase subunit PxpA n=1 Tax=unclassified Oceanobacter TaxID=2620260 RepID=UPI0026E447E8|nr:MULTISPECIES: 5-oxoprolinase subunit PxpA [unclassified Oceanobacter]MDO6683385.1 5-oxoprolinase subunit PxpA [Oceanobacter sp. 5_MG-2023]MDP2505935.1 5-oxoprolinase subunit PxpA [Oceanobacter sp. 3_MG-2023]MDP2547812.1 5-oxoprolinase subunit PxpA [Oceanobacter sp. 4_MG-2023]MDP2608413.1 5-oxoprolinase subunit PxpA [Oceanobacter sp. 1_MG-2023]MDP2611508.1 5-oxoprolinase subunit PxpA [Oceanobacter sp. 2_MG-2023]